MTGWAGRMRVYLVHFSVSVLCLPTMFRVCILTVLCGCAGAVAPDSCSGTIMTSFVGRKLCFRRIFGYFGVLLVLPKFKFLPLPTLVAWV